MADDYFSVQDLGGGVFAIGEPRSDQQNFEYLIIGQKRALLIDASDGTHDQARVVRALTTLPVTVIPTHLHFDHLGGIAAWRDIAMIDVPATRADVQGNTFAPSFFEYLAPHRPSFKVTEWVKPGAMIDLGGRTVQALYTPGHTPNSVSLYDAQTHRLFSGDYVYPTTLYAQLPGASLSAYQDTARRLLRDLPPNTILYAAHCCRVGEGIAAPWLTMNDLSDLDRALTAIRSGQAQSTGFYPRRYPVNHQMTIVTGFGWNNR
jgi:glyoxylase-like metal-dependent hydrolase (beta-lactamase superfamily II)